MDDYIERKITQVNAKELYLNSDISWFYQNPYPGIKSPYLSFPDGKYYLQLLPEEYEQNPPKKNDPFEPKFYIFNSDDKWTGYVIQITILDENEEPIKFNLLSNSNPQYKLIAEKGNYTIKVKKNQKVKLLYADFLKSFFSRKLQKTVVFDKYPSYTPTQNEITKTTGTIVSGDTNQPIKGATIEKTD
jgi:hypothetical protein